MSYGYQSRMPLGNRGNRSYGGGRSGGGGRSKYGGRRERAAKNSFGIRSDQIGGKVQAIDWAREALAPFVRGAWAGQLSPPTVQEAQLWRQQAEVLVEGPDIPLPVLNFMNANLPENCVRKFAELGFRAPTPIQAQGWPMALSGRDVVGIAETGSGKTLAFILPGIIHIQSQPISQMQQNWGTTNGPIALVVAPTRELAIQIQTETQKFAYAVGVTVACVYGGAPRRRQESMLRQGMQFLIATPGRLLDFLERRVFTLKTCSYCVFDEADRMLDMGFEPQIRALMSQIRPDRQMLMWSATWPKEVRTLARDYLAQDRLFLKIGDENKAAVTVTQVVEVIDRAMKNRRLQEILGQYRGAKVIVFAGTKRMADQLSRDLRQQGVPAAAIHGDKEQWQREQSLQDFKAGKITVLVATDVASRGIDVKDLALVLNYDFPQNCEDYIHRVGRTGRAGNQGTAITFFVPRQDAKHSKKLVQLLEKNNQEVPPQLRSLSMQNRNFGGRNRYRQNGGGRSGGRRDHRPSGGSRGFRPY